VLNRVNVSPCEVSTVTADQLSEGQVTIDILPDDSLLDIFKIYTDEVMPGWHTLVHVCRRWRDVVFTSPHHLNLRLRCTYMTPARKTLNIWPALPIAIQDGRGGASRGRGGIDNVIAALEHHDRVCRIDLSDIPVLVLKKFAAAMKGPFPALTSLELHSGNKAPALPDSFLGGSAPRLQMLVLWGIPFTAIPKLLLSASDLVTLRLWEIPHSGYISPKVMAVCLSSLTRLKTLWIGFQSPRSRPNRLRPPSLTRVALPALTYFRFRGVNEYLEDLVVRIHSPLLSHLSVTFFNQLIFNTVQLMQFVSRAEKLTTYDRAQVTLFLSSIKLSVQMGTISFPRLELRILCNASDWQLSALAQVCDSSLPPLSTLNRLDIHENAHSPPNWVEDMENALWLDLLRPFTAVKNLDLSRELGERVTPTMQDLAGESVTVVLPALQHLSVDGCSGIGLHPIQLLAAARRLISARRVASASSLGHS
jgi:hypothetical protein